jgi:hypothetical protein
MSENARRLLAPAGNRTMSLLVLLVAVFAAVGLSIGYTARTVHHSDQQWCELLRSIDVPLPSGTPATQRSRDFARQVHELRIRKGC